MVGPSAKNTTQIKQVRNNTDAMDAVANTAFEEISIDRFA